MVLRVRRWGCEIVLNVQVEEEEEGEDDDDDGGGEERWSESGVKTSVGLLILVTERGVRPLVFPWVWKGKGGWRRAGVCWICWGFKWKYYPSANFPPDFHIGVQHNGGLLQIFWPFIFFNLCPHRWSQRHKPRGRSRNHIRSISETIRGRSHGENGHQRAQEAPAVLLVLRSEPCGAVQTQPGVELTGNVRFNSRLYTILIKDKIPLSISVTGIFSVCIRPIFKIYICSMFFL